ncbi:hypothetical protein BDV18DRAFT_163732 [Aspergillus unguis]
MPMNWSEQLDAKARTPHLIHSREECGQYTRQNANHPSTQLLLRIITTNQLKVNWTDLAEYMGPECTVIAAQRRFQRLKDKAQAEQDASAANGGYNGAEDGTSISEAASTGTSAPGKRKRGRPKKNTSEDEENGAGPAKMQKCSRVRGRGEDAAASKKHSPAIKDEDETE